MPNTYCRDGNYFIQTPKKGWVLIDGPWYDLLLGLYKIRGGNLNLGWGGSAEGVSWKLIYWINHVSLSEKRFYSWDALLRIYPFRRHMGLVCGEPGVIPKNMTSK